MYFYTRSLSMGCLLMWQMTKYSQRLAKMVWCWCSIYVWVRISWRCQKVEHPITLFNFIHPMGIPLSRQMKKMVLHFGIYEIANSRFHFLFPSNLNRFSTDTLFISSIDFLSSIFEFRPFIRYDGEKDCVQSCMSVRFNTHGTQVLALRRRLPPILYNTNSEDSICQFYHADYFNSCTMKSCSFAGDNDEYVISGSDDFNLYMWRVTDANGKFHRVKAEVDRFWVVPSIIYTVEHWQLFDMIWFYFVFKQQIKRISGLIHITWFCTVIDL